MKKITFLLCISIICFSLLSAETPQAAGQRTPEARANDKVMQLSKSGTLQSSQIEKINKLFIEYYTKQDALRAKQATLDAKEYTKQMADLKNQNNNSIKAVLTPDQLKTYEEIELKRQTRNTPAKPNN